jgi:HAAS domain-containing protein
MDKLEQYLDQVCRSLGGSRSMRQHVRQELAEHLRDAAAQHRTAGLSEEQALERALADFGGPDQVRSELEATHGHSLMAVVIDKAMEWKEKTMKARWLWTSWAHGMLGAVIALEILFITFNVIFIIPKFQKLMIDGIIDPSIVDEEGIGWFVNYLHTLSTIAGQYTIWFILVPAVLWGLFEWRVQSEHKVFMRLAALGTVATALLVVIILMGMALVVSFTMGVPGLGRIARPWVMEQVSTIDTSINAVEQSLKEKNWQALPEHVEQARAAATRLTVGPAPSALVRENANAKIREMREQIRALSTPLTSLQQAVREQDSKKTEAALQDFRDAFGPVRDAAQTMRKP